MAETPNIKRGPNHEHAALNKDQFSKTTLIIAWLVTTLIACVGGYIGIKEMLAKPDFKFTLIGQISKPVNYPNGSVQGSLFFLSASIYNSGSKPFFPDSWEMDIYIAGDTLTIPISPIPEDFEKRITDKRIIRFNNPHERDIARLTKVNPDDAFYGHLLFFVKEPYITFQYNTDVKFRIKVADLNEKKYRSKVYQLDPNHPFFINNPKANILIYDTAEINAIIRRGDTIGTINRIINPPDTAW